MTNEELKQFKESLSITAVAKALGIDVVHGRCRCFFPQRHAHGDRTPSVSFSEERGTFRCWVCDDVRGDVISLVQLCKNMSFLEAVEWLKSEFSFLVGSPKPVEKPSPSRTREPVLREPEIEPPQKPLIKEEDRRNLIFSFLKMLKPIEHTPAGAYLSRRRIYKPVWDKMRIRTIDDYEEISGRLREIYSLEVLQYVGLFNERGNLRFYKHPLIFPYLDSKMRSFYFQARAIDKSIVPKELNLRGTVPFPYNVSALDEKPGWVYLCEGVVDTLTFIGRNVPAVGIPGVRSFKMEWLPLFKNKSVVLCLDNDEAGRNGMEYIQGVFDQAGIRSTILGTGMENLSSAMKEGEDINDWFGRRK
ncbi:MAG: toprim domain-containing protein [Fibrobacter sp.]|nr:toprim domain-containing protein [Fibrobacter sp.]